MDSSVSNQCRITEPKMEFCVKKFKKKFNVELPWSGQEPDDGPSSNLRFRHKNSSSKKTVTIKQQDTWMLFLKSITPVTIASNNLVLN